MDEGGYKPGPYEQLIAAYRTAGEELHARQVALVKQRRRRLTLPWPGKMLGYFLDWTVGYGYRNWLASLWLILFLTVGTICFSVWHGTPVKADGGGGSFQAFIFALDHLLPIVDLGQKKNFVAQPPVQWLPWLLVLVGWGLTTAVVAGIARVLNRT
ncbi:MAG: hypothetical protein LC776_18035 [Acidobacteria bacterium]|nr:hypothetical protein [Acidobacteriota bacterium]